jgi:subtilisin family serine protease
MKNNYNSRMLLRKTSISVFTALYVAASGHAVAAPGVQKVEGSSFYIPTFTAEDLENHKASVTGNFENDFLSGQVGRTNRHFNQLTPEQIFQPEEGVTGKQKYIVQLSDEPLATYGGGIAGLASTKAVKGSLMLSKVGIDLNSQPARDYTTYLKSEQQSFVNQVRSAGINVSLQKQYTVANNAILVEMSQDDALLMAKQPGVKRITKNRIFQVQTDRGPEFVGAEQAWNGSVTPQSLPVQGEGMVVGIIDTGINTDHPAFAADESYQDTNPFGAGNFIGDCLENASLCNDKLIGIRSYKEITDVYKAKEFQKYSWKKDMIRPANGEDYNGHGSHTASTAAGNYLENTPLQAPKGEKTSDGLDLPFTFEHTSGVGLPGIGAFISI